MPSLAQPVPDDGSATLPNVLSDLLAAPVELGDTYWAAERDEPVSVTIISAEEIARYGYETLDEALQHVRGFTTSTDYLYAQIGARGLSLPDDRGRRMLVMVDGESTHEYIFGGTALEAGLVVPMDALERIEVIRGPGSARYGTGALTVAINLVTKSGVRLAGARARLTQFGDEGTAAHISLGNQAGDVSWSVSVSGNARAEQVAEIAEGFTPTQDSNRERGYHLFGQVEWRGIRLLAEHGMREKRVPTRPFGSSLERLFTTVDERSRISLSAERVLSPSLSASAQVFGNWFYGSVQSFSERRDISIDSEGSDTGFGGIAQATWTPRAWYGLRFGGESRGHPKQYYTLNNGLLSAETSLSQGAVFAEQDMGLTSRLTLTTGARYDFIYGDEVTRSFNPRAALVYTPLSRTSFKALYSSSFRVASLFENRTRGQIDPLRAERFRSAELIWLQRWSDRTSFSISTYRSWIHDLIATPPGKEGSFSLYENRIEANLTGVETELRYLGEDHGAYAQVAFQRAHDHTADEPLPGAPSTIVQAGGHAQWRPGMLALQVVANSSVQGFENAVKTPGWWMLHATYTSPPAWQRVRARIQIRNVFDRNWRIPAGPSLRFETLPQPGRQVRLSISATL